MEMNRRFFMAIAASAGMDTEQLLWVPGRKLISIAAPLDVAPVETLFGMPELLPFNVPLTKRVRALLALDSSAHGMAEGSGTVRFIEDARGYDFGEVKSAFYRSRLPSCSYDGLIVSPLPRTHLGNYKLG